MSTFEKWFMNKTMDLLTPVHLITLLICLYISCKYCSTHAPHHYYKVISLHVQMWKV